MDGRGNNTVTSNSTGAEKSEHSASISDQPDIVKAATIFALSNATMQWYITNRQKPEENRTPLQDILASTSNEIIDYTVVHPNQERMAALIKNFEQAALIEATKKQSLFR